MHQAALSVLFALLLSLGLLAQSSAQSLTLNQAKARDIFQRVIAFKTSVGLGQVPALAEYLAGEFRAAGFADSDIHILPLGETASLVVRYRGDGSGGKPILVMAHMDVVTASARTGSAIRSRSSRRTAISTDAARSTSRLA